ncbi:AAA family ATPase [Thalassospira australica]|uniref:AAA family ATPase n=1 Tax=Thalassospira australica TaxID=1528106 RepID=UPI00051A65CD|nr:AAA family ATPase [Thalassospira australica]
MQTPITSNLVVITGGPGAGKTTLINHLHERGFDTSPEVARAIIEEQQERGGNALPWADNDAYAGLMYRRSIRAWQDAIQAHPRTVFCDRGLPDTLAHRQISGLDDDPGLHRAINTYRYHKMAFVLPPWSDIYKPDDARTQSFSDAVRTYVVLCRVYAQCGYDLIEVRKGSVEQRAAQILSRLKL